ncbi:hypothetical protein FH972_015884 [Carpinus fangiana]|uniref:Uncharacterized protein n=1 Tax=Carpinus fangiana TaxID=176857 RepID=A0A5N6REG9_9ROSI|nr:hypothetical protein FH972_015884 [Carpinus fangiana]
MATSGIVASDRLQLRMDTKFFKSHVGALGWTWGREMYYITWVSQYLTLLGNMGFILFGGKALKCYLPTMVNPSTTTLVTSQDHVSSSFTVDIGVDMINAYGAPSSCFDFLE